MQWNEIRQAFPSRWLLVEAIRAHTSNKYRIIEDFAVLSEHPDSVSAMKAYESLH